jgi:hypothetical protein
MRRLLRGLAAALLLLAVAPPAAVPRDAPETHSYVIRRDGLPIGTQHIRIDRDATGMTASGETKVAVSVLGVIVYRYSERWRETWRDGAFAGLEATVNDDGKVSRLAVARTDAGLIAEGPDGPRKLPDDAIPETYWNAATRTAKRLIDLETGKVSHVAPRPAATETIDGKRLRRVELAGDQPRTLWYAPDGTWIGIRLTARDGSEVRIMRGDL